MNLLLAWICANQSIMVVVRCTQRGLGEPLWRISFFYSEWKSLELMTKGDFAPIATSASMAVVRKTKCNNV